MKLNILSTVIASFIVLSCNLNIHNGSDQKPVLPPTQAPHLQKYSHVQIRNELKRNWKLIEFQHFTKDNLIENNAELNLNPNPETGQYSAYFGCNNLFFILKDVSNNSLEFSHIGTTMLDCDEKMDLEMEASQFLTGKIFYIIQGHFLELKNNKGDKMRFIAEDWD